MVCPYPEQSGEISGGVMGVSVYLTEALARLPEIDLEIIVPDSAVGVERTVALPGRTVHYLPAQRGRGTALKYAWTNPRAVARRLLGLSPDLVHVQNWASFVPFLKYPHVLTVHGILERDILYRGRFRQPRSWLMKQLETNGRRRAGNVIVISPYVRDVLAANLRGRTWDIDNPVADELFEVVRRPVPGRVLFAGRITALKNVHGLIEGFARVAAENPAAELVLAGGGTDGGYAQRCRRRAEDLGIASRVCFLGSLGREEFKEQLSLAACLALASFQENAPLVLAEAMAAGVPVVASRVGGIPHMIEDKMSGVLFDPTRSEDLAAGLRYVLTPEHADAVARAAKTSAEHRYRASSVARRTLEVYQEVLQERDSRMRPIKKRPGGRMMGPR
jgi:glycosyltransferase involved in cell wall biosynthesis